MSRPPKPFWDCVDQSGGIDACWPWMSHRTAKGYGTRKHAGKTEQAHRVAFTLATGAWSKFNTCHTCDNPPCCNPAHLFDGTNADNSLDKARKGRGFHKLPAASVRAIRAIQGRTQLSISKEFGVTPQTISRIRRGELRQHITQEN